MLCAKMDAQLLRLARRCGCSYSRYADDITFSTFAPSFPEELAVRSPGAPAFCTVGDPLQALIDGNGFAINEQKVRLSNHRRRQEVTGLVVNARVNVRREFVRRVRCMLHAWEKFGLDEAASEHRSRYSRQHRPGAEGPPFADVLRGKVEYIGMVKGRADAVYLNLRRRLAALDENDRWVDVFSTEGRLREAVWVVESEIDGEAVQGTAFWMEGVGLVTCAHVVGDQARVFKSHRQEDAIAARVLRRDMEQDVAILEVAVEPATTLARASREGLQRGDRIRLAGFPHHEEHDEVVLADGTVIQVRPRRRLFNIDAPIVAGTSGGPVLNSDLEVVGIAVTGERNWAGTAPDVRESPYGVRPIDVVDGLLDLDSP
jgi:hypothetical protein